MLIAATAYRRSRPIQPGFEWIILASIVLTAGCAGHNTQPGRTPEHTDDLAGDVSIPAEAAGLQPAPAKDAPAPIDKLFDPRHVVDVRIEMKKEDWDQVRLQDRGGFLKAFMSPTESPFKYARADVTIDGVPIKDVGVRKKGFLGSLDTARPSLKITFDKYVDQAPFGAMDRLTLNNNKQDTSRLSQYLSYRLFNESGTVASRCNFAKVTVNDEYLGVYSNVESVKPPMLERGFGDGSGALFEGTLVDLITSQVTRFEIKTDAADHADLQAIAEVLEEEKLDVKKLGSLLDIEAFVRFWAMESLIGFWDGYTHNQNNFFIYRNPANAKFYFMPWGADSAFAPAPPFFIDHIRVKSAHSQSVLANRLYHNPEIRELYRKTLVRFLSTHWNEDVLLAEVDRVESMLAGDVLEGKSYSQAVRRVRSFIKRRRRVMEKELKRWPIPLKTGPRELICIKEIGRARVKFATEWYAKAPSKPETRGNVEIDLTLDGKHVTFRRIGAAARFDEDKEQKVQIGLTGRRESDRTKLRLISKLDVACFQPTREPVEISGFLIEGGIFSFLVEAVLNPLGLTFIDGEATFDQAGMEPGTPVQGKLDLRILKIAGGESPETGWEGSGI